MLEKESRDLKLKVRQLEEKLESNKSQEVGHTIPPKGVPSGEGGVPAGVNNAYLKSHIQSLHDTIGKWLNVPSGQIANISEKTLAQ